MQILFKVFIVVSLSLLVYMARNPSIKDTPLIEYKWVEYDNRWDCVVGIAIEGKPTSMGVLIRPNIVLTAANPIEYIRRTEHMAEIYFIDGAFDKSKRYYGNCMIPGIWYGKDRITLKNHWVAMGNDSEKISPLHDLFTIAFELDFKKPLKLDVKKRSETQGRLPFVAKLALPNDTISSRHWTFVGFGYIDKTHVINSTILEIEDYGDEHVLVNCDEYVPRQWGRFICIKNFYKNAGVIEGAPLFHKGILFGIGSFNLKKNDENIHVFTDIRPYMRNLSICKHENKTYPDWWYTYDLDNFTEKLPY